MPECGRHHLSHIATESVNTHGCPIHQYIGHLAPCVGHWCEVLRTSTSIEIVNTIVEFDSLIPIVHTGRSIEMVISCSLSRELAIRFCLTCVGINMWLEWSAWTIVEIIGSRKTHRRVIVLTKVVDTFGLCRRVVLTSHVVWHKIDYYLQSGTMASVK